MHLLCVCVCVCVWRYMSEHMIVVSGFSFFSQYACVYVFVYMFLGTFVWAAAFCTVFASALYLTAVNSFILFFIEFTTHWAGLWRYFTVSVLMIWQWCLLFDIQYILNVKLWLFFKLFVIKWRLSQKVPNFRVSRYFYSLLGYFCLFLFSCLFLWP